MEAFMATPRVSSVTPVDLRRRSETPRKTELPDPKAEHGLASREQGLISRSIDCVETASIDSFPCSDPPGYYSIST
jgi:hypothetical protein